MKPTTIVFFDLFFAFSIAFGALAIAEAFKLHKQVEFYAAFMVNCLNQKVMIVGGEQGTGVICTTL